MILMILGFVGGLALLAYLFVIFLEGDRNYWTKKKIFQLNNNEIAPLLDRFLFRATFHEMDKNLYTAMKKHKADKVGGLVQFRHPVLVIMDLDIIKNVLVKDFDHFVNRRGLDFNDPDFNKMLFNMIDQEWKDLRAIMSPTFTTGKIKRMFGIFMESGEKLTKYLNREIEEGNGNVELRKACGMYTMDVIAGAAFGMDSQNFENENSPFAENGRKLQDSLKLGLLIKFIAAMAFPKISKYMQASFFNQEALGFLTGALKQSIKRRRELGEKHNDFLQLMLEAQTNRLESEPLEEADKDGHIKSSENGKSIELTDDCIISQCNLFFLAGFDTTETLLMYSAYELAVNPEVQETLYAELKESALNNGGELVYDSVVNLKYLDMVVSETLRKYPAAVRLERKCNRDYKIPDTNLTIEKGTHVIIPTYGIHHDPEIYPNPSKFDPERFNPENKAARHPYAYMPFGLGPRHCIAMRFAIVEGKAAVAHLVLNFKLSPSSRTHIPMKYTTKGIMKPEGGMWLKLKSRN